LRSERKMRIFEKDRCTSVDFLKRRISVFHLKAPAEGATPEIALDHTDYPPSDALAEEIASFLAAVRGDHPPRVTGEDGRRALEAALTIDRQLRDHRRRLGLAGAGD
jgi:predicted dehydrogenase